MHRSCAMYLLTPQGKFYLRLIKCKLRDAFSAVEIFHVMPEVQVVALDSSGIAAGDLFIDDGSSFGYERGAYLHRHFRCSFTLLASSLSAIVWSWWKPCGHVTAYNISYVRL